MSDINKKILTLSVVLGDKCNADCKFCISKLTFKNSPKKCEYWWDKLRKACMVAEKGGADTVIITGKHEPTMADVDDLFRTIEICAKYFPIVELQTNGMKLEKPLFVRNLANAGLTTLAISCVSPTQQIINQEMISSNYPDLQKIVPEASELGLLMRACIIMTRDIFVPWSNLAQVLGQAINVGFHQVTLRLMGTPDVSRIQDTAKAETVVKWIEEHKLSDDELFAIRCAFGEMPLLREYPWGSEIRSYNGTSVCIADCLSDQTNNDYRYVIYFPDGHLRYRWESPEALIF